MVEKIGYTRAAAGGRPVKRTGAVDGSKFADALAAAEGAGGVEAAEATGSIAGMSGVGALLGAQEVSEHEVRKRKSIKRAGLTLGALEQLRDALLMGTLPLATLNRLEALVTEERSQTNDPVLQQILDEIELRAAVELAKLEVSGMLQRNS